jgi:hypothetical protein
MSKSVGPEPPTMTLYHFSEEPGIDRVQPRAARSSTLGHEPLVWAVDEWFAPMYYVPRHCPRACFWPGRRTTPEDRERWLGGLEPRFVLAVESAWLDRIRRARIYRYAMPEDSFESMGHEIGHWVSRSAVSPLGVEPMGDLMQAIADAGVELRITPRLGAMWGRVSRQSTLEYSGSGLRFAAGYPQEFE